MDKIGMCHFLAKVAVGKLNENWQSQLVNGPGRGCWMQAVNSSPATGQHALPIRKIVLPSRIPKWV